MKGAKDYQLLMSDATRELLRTGASRLELQLSEDTLVQLGLFAELLLEWNQKINLTATRSIDEVIGRHVVDSLALVPVVPSAGTMLDVGAGGGFPGAVLAIVLPQVQITCVDSIQKKVSFLEAVRRKLAPNMVPICGRIEALTDLGPFNGVVSRATFAPVEWVQVGAPFVAEDGMMAAMLTDDAQIPNPPKGFALAESLNYEIDQGRVRRIQTYRRCST